MRSTPSSALPASAKPALARGFLVRFLPAGAVVVGLAGYLHVQHSVSGAAVVGGGAVLLALAAATAFLLARQRLMLEQAVAKAEESETALARSADFVTQVLDALDVPVFVKDRDRRLALVNRAFCDYVGRPRGELQDRRSDEVLVTLDATRGQEIVTARDGTQRGMLTEKTVAAGGDVVVGIVTDVADRQRGDEALQLTASVFEHSAEGILVTDAGNRIVRVNRAFSEISGYALEELIGQTPAFLASGHHAPDFYAAMWQRLRQEGHWQGEVLNRRKSGAVAAEWLNISTVTDEQGRVLRYIAIYGEITDRKGGEARTRYLAQHDVLTGLVNRNLLGDRLNSAILQAQRAGRRVALLTIDLDRFRPINDRLGYLAGDRLLCDVARRLASTVRRIDTVARIGGDKFAIVLLGIHDAADAALVADRLIGRLEAPFLLEGESVQISASIGIALDHDHGADVETLLAASEAAVRRAKRVGGMRYAMASAPAPAPVPAIAEASVA